MHVILQKVIASAQQITRDASSDAVQTKAALSPTRAASAEATADRLSSIDSIINPNAGRAHTALDAQGAFAPQQGAQLAPRDGGSFSSSALFDQPLGQQSASYGNGVPLSAHPSDAKPAAMAGGMQGVPARGAASNVAYLQDHGHFSTASVPVSQTPADASAAAHDAKLCPAPGLPTLPALAGGRGYASAVAHLRGAPSPTGAAAGRVPQPKALGPGVPSSVEGGTKPMSGSASSAADPSAARAEEAAISIMRSLNLGPAAPKKPSAGKSRSGKRGQA